MTHSMDIEKKVAELESKLASTEKLYQDLAHYAISWLMTSECHHKDDDVCVSRKELETRAHNAFDWVDINGKKVPKNDPPSVVALVEKQRLVDELVEVLRETSYGTCAEGDNCVDPICAKATALLSRVKGGVE